MTAPLRARVIVVLVILLGARLATAERAPVPTPLPVPLSSFPFELQAWHGYAGTPLDPDTIRVLGADEYLNRIYEHPQHGPASLFVAHYGSQQRGDAIHSPQNCLPGSGWAPVSRSRDVIEAPGIQAPVNHYIVERRGDRQLVVYWFQGRGRVVASEYVNKAYLFHDALTRGRSDGALVRIITPVVAGEASAGDAARDLAQALLPALSRWLP